MNKHCLRLALAGAFGLTVAAHGASFDLNRILGVGKDVATAATGISEKDEITIGREVAGRTLGAAPLVSDPALQTYVNSVGRWVASQSERPDLPWRFGVIETPGVNAFAAPGGYVLITRGLYEVLENESQLAGVLGHEIAHIVKRHHITVMQKSAGVSALAGAAQTAATARGDRSAILNNVIGTGAEIFARGLDKDAEYEADHLGVVLAARAGYNPSGLIEVLHKLQARGAADASLALLFATHPHPGERLSKLAEAMAPHMARFPAGHEPRIQPIAVAAPAGSAVRAATPPPGVRALSSDPEPAPSSLPSGLLGGQQRGRSSGTPIEGLLRGIIGR